MTPRPPAPAEALARSIPARPPVEVGPGAGRLSIFVPAVMAGGLLFSLVILLRDVVERTIGQRRVLRRGAMLGHETAAVVAHGDAGRKARRGGAAVPRGVHNRGLGLLRSRHLGCPGATFNYLHAGFYNADIAWMLAWCLLAALVFAVVGVTSLTIAGRHRSVPAGPAPAVRDTAEPGDDRCWWGATGRASRSAGPPGRWPRRRVARRIRVAAWAWAVLAIADVPGARRRGRYPRTPRAGSWAERSRSRCNSACSPSWRPACSSPGSARRSAWRSWPSRPPDLASSPPSVSAADRAPGHRHLRGSRRAAVGRPSEHPAAALLLTLAVVTGLLLTGVWAGGSRVYASYFGPAHPSSALHPAGRPGDVGVGGRVDGRLLHRHRSAGLRR